MAVSINIGSRQVEVSWTLVSVVAALTAVYGINRVLSYYRLRRFRGPWLASFTSFWIVKTTLGGKIHLELARVNEKYGRFSTSSIEMCPSLMGAAQGHLRV